MPLIEVTKSWSSNFNRFAVGSLAIFYFHSIGFLPIPPLDKAVLGSTPVDLSFFIGLIAFTVSSSLLGMLIVPLGRPAFESETFSEKSRLRRAMRVGSSQNAMLIEMCRDAHAKAELAMGVMGLIIFCVTITLVWMGYSWFFGELSETISFGVDRSNLDTLPAAFLGIATSWWMKHAVGNTLREIDAITDYVSSEAKTHDP